MDSDFENGIFRFTPLRPKTTLLGSHVPTEEERKASFAEARRHWQDKTASTLFALARSDQILARRLCKEVAQLALEDDALRVLFIDWMRDKSVAPKGRRVEWTRARHHFLLVHYYLKLNEDPKLRRADVLEALCQMEGIKSHQAMENRILKAKRDVEISELPEFIQEIAKSA